MNKRYDYLDNLKWVLICMVIGHHTCIAFGGSGDGGYYTISTTNIFAKKIFDAYLGFQQSFFMSLFFAISSFFLLPSLCRKGSLIFFMDRLKRLGIPIVFMVLIIVPIMRMWSDYLYHKPKVFSINLINVDQLWFTRTLLIFTVATLIYLTIFKSKSLLSKVESKPLTHKCISLFVVFLLALQAITVYFVPIIVPRIVLEYILPFLSASGLNDVALYIAFFVVGMKAYKGNWLKSLSIEVSWPWFLLALISYGACTVLNFLGHNDAAVFFYNIGKPIVCVGVCLLFVALFKKYCNQHTKLSRNLSLSAYTAYIFQRPFITGATILVGKLHIYPVFGFLMAAILAIVSTFFAAYFIRKLPWMRHVL